MTTTATLLRTDQTEIAAFNRTDGICQDTMQSGELAHSQNYCRHPLDRRDEIIFPSPSVCLSVSNRGSFFSYCPRGHNGAAAAAATTSGVDWASSVLSLIHI